MQHVRNLREAKPATLLLKYSAPAFIDHTCGAKKNMIVYRR